MARTVTLSAKARRLRGKLPPKIDLVFQVLLADLEAGGPVRLNWPNYSKLTPLRHHCHIKKGRPTFVAVWEVCKGEIRVLEVTYVGTHEKAPY